MTFLKDNFYKRVGIGILVKEIIMYLYCSRCIEFLEVVEELESNMMGMERVV